MSCPQAGLHEADTKLAYMKLSLTHKQFAKTLCGYICHPLVFLTRLRTIGVCTNRPFATPKINLGEIVSENQSQLKGERVISSGARLDTATRRQYALETPASIWLVSTLFIFFMLSSAFWGIRYSKINGPKMKRHAKTTKAMVAAPLANSASIT